ncbi:MAG: hypothetical protein E6Q99_04495 [Elusimicrobia bacterium]|nr:MAG: hypothetical protein E6Q99_04495 [Elusimicrobiota bacterium]
MTLPAIIPCDESIARWLSRKPPLAQEVVTLRRVLCIFQRGSALDMSTLYDLLEVSQSASTEAISASYRRLDSQLSASADASDPDTVNRLIALREAHQVLVDPVQRARYDQRLNARQNAASAVQVEAPARLWPKLLLLAVLLGLCGVGYSKYQSDQERARLERERIALDEKKMQAAAERQRQRDEQLAAERAESQFRRQEAKERQDQDRAIAYGRQVTRALERNAEQLRREQEREERQRRYEVERRLAQDRAYVRQLEAENARYSRRY